MPLPRESTEGTSASDEDAHKASSPATKRSSNGAHRSRSKRTGEGPYERLTSTELEGALKEVRNLRLLLDVANKKNINLVKSQQELSDKLGESDVTISKANDNVRMLQKHVREQAHQIADLTMDRNQLVEKTRELGACHRQKQDIEALLRIRTAELRDAQQYLAKVDAVSYADVRRMVETLNSQIYQLAAQVVDGLSFEKKRSHPMPEPVQAYRKSVGEILGSEYFASVVSTSAHADDPTLVQVMIQAYLAQSASDTIRAWAAADIDTSQDRLLSVIHDNIRTNESQVVSARWRTLTRRYIDPRNEYYEQHSFNTRSSVTRGLYQILTLSGAAISENTKDMENKVLDEFGEKVASIVRGALEVRKVIGEEMATTDFEVFCPRYGQRFVADMMEDMDGPSARDGTSESSKSNDVILCTTGLGLRRYGKKAIAGDSKEEWEESVLLKAKVALPTLMEVFASQLEMGNV